MIRDKIAPISSLTLILLFSFLSVAQATNSQIVVTTLNVQAMRDVVGSHSSDQPLSVLNSASLSGSLDNWEDYIEFYPKSRKTYKGLFTFRLPAGMDRFSIRKITVKTNYRGPLKSDQRWIWGLFNFQKKQYAVIGDNQSAKEWIWTSMSYAVMGNSYVNSDGLILLKLISNNDYDVCNIDHLNIQVHAVKNDPVEEGDEEPANETPADETPAGQDTVVPTNPTLVNKAPVVDAGVDQVLQLPLDTVTLTGGASDDGLPQGASLKVSWTMFSGPEKTTILSADQLTTQVRFSAAGEYQFKLIATDGALTTKDLVVVKVLPAESTAEDDFKNVSLKSRITHVQPMTGIVLWTDSEHNSTENIQLEYAYMHYNRVVQNKGQFNWNAVDQLLSQVASRGHQAILRFYDTYPGQKTTIPDYIKNSSGYSETKGQSEGLTTWFPDWSFAELQAFALDFYSRFAARYDNDPRMAFLQVGFGLWGEYHIYDGPMILGKTFPSKVFQIQFIKHLDKVFNKLPWNISIDAADNEVAPFGGDAALAALPFGLFDDSFLHKTHSQYNAECFNFLGYKNRYKLSPMGGELSYYTDFDQKHALDSKGPYGVAFESLAGAYHISYMIGNDQPDYQTMARIAEAGRATGYKFSVTAFKASSTQSRITVKNNGIAPIYYDAYVAVNGVRSAESLKGLLPGQSKEYAISSASTSPQVTIECDRLVPGQKIEFDADL